MATEKDYSAIPAIVTITNLAEDVEVFDGGTKAEEVTIPVEEVRPGEKILSYGETEEGEEDKTKAVVMRKYIKAARKVQLYMTNQWVLLENTGDSVKIYAQTSAAVQYYDSLEDADLSVEVNPAE